MTGLGALQRAMLASIVDIGAGLPEGWTPRQAAGLEIYRNNYRASLLTAMTATFERTVRLVGEDSFRAAAAHHCITHPPTSWTLDLAGAGFAETCARLFAADPDVSELAALEWAMHLAFVARDAVPLDAAGFAQATASFTDEDWSRLTLEFVPGLNVAAARFDLLRLWTSLGEKPFVAEVLPLDQTLAAVIWREGERPVFDLRPDWEGRALAAMRQGETFTDACSILAAELDEETAVREAGAMLARWLNDGLVSALLR